MKGVTMRSWIRIAALVLFLAVCMAMLTPVLAAPADQECARDARYPDARFTCIFAEPATRGSSLPEGLPIGITCTDQSVTEQAIASWRWDFGDGGTSTRQSPVHSYTRAGSYQISLTVTTVCGGQYTSTAVNGMDVYCIPPEPYFTVDTDAGTAPLTVHVRDGSRFVPEDVTRWTYWLDATHKSTDRNPIYIYTRPGIYTINLSLAKECVRPGIRAAPPYEHKINVTSPVVSVVGVYFNLSNTTTPPATTSAGTGALRANAQPPTIIPRTTLTGLVTATAPPASAIQQATPVPGTGTLSVTTNPAGAQVFIDDVLRGASPATVPNLPAGSHTLRLEKEGYRNMTVPVDITDGKTTGYTTALVPESGSSTVSLPFIAMAVGIFILAGTGAYLYGKKKKSP
jgi:hypothetical protein